MPNVPTVHLSTERLDTEFLLVLRAALGMPSELELDDFLDDANAALTIIDIDGGRWYELILLEETVPNAPDQETTGMAVRDQYGRVNVYWDGWAD